MLGREFAVRLKRGGNESNPSGIDWRAVSGDLVEGIGGNGSRNFAGNVPAGNVVREAWRVSSDAGDGVAPSDYV